MPGQGIKLVDLYELDDDQKIIFREIAENSRVNYFQLEAALRAHNGHGKMKHDELRRLIRDRITRLKRLHWIEELTSSREELSVFYLTADGSIAAGGKF